MTKLSSFHVLIAVTSAYAAFLFYLSSLSSPPGLHDPGFLRTLLTLLKDMGLEFLTYPLYPVYKYPDKAAHVVLYMGFGLLLNPTLSTSNSYILKEHAAPLSIAIGTLYGVTDEFHQSFVPYRSADPVDLLADFVGLFIAQLLIIGYHSLKRYSRGSA